MEDLKPGVYRHSKEGRFYQLLRVAELDYEAVAADEVIEVYVLGARDGYSPPRGPFALPASAVANDLRAEIDGMGLILETARAHGPMKRGERVAIYVPLYADKPGRRISVRPVSEWTGQVHVRLEACPENDPQCAGVHWKRRFEYVGDVIPAEMLPKDVR